MNQKKVGRVTGRRTAALQNLRCFEAHPERAPASWSAAVPLPLFDYQSALLDLELATATPIVK